MSPRKSKQPQDSRRQRYRVAVTMGGNTNRDYKLKPVVIYHTDNLGTLRGFLTS
jgi:hypothetical protein